MVFPAVCPETSGIGSRLLTVKVTATSHQEMKHNTMLSSILGQNSALYSNNNEHCPLAGLLLSLAQLILIKKMTTKVFLLLLLQHYNHFQSGTMASPEKIRSDSFFSLSHSSKLIFFFFFNFMHFSS